jgi:hypothetical protein
MPGNVLHQVVSLDGSVLRIDRSADPKLMFSTDPGRFEFDLADFDAYVLCGLGLSLFRILTLCETHVPDDFRPPYNNRQLVSSECFRSASIAASHTYQAFRRSREIAALFDRPIVALPEPLPSHMNKDNAKFRPLREAIEGGNEMALARYFEAMLAGFSTPQIAVVRQPAETLQSPVLTRPAFARDSKRLRSDIVADHADNEALHMNGEFGAIMLREGLKHILH